MSTVSALGGAGSLFQAKGSKETALGKNDFLKLLVAQLQNQDPLKPADATQFTAQLAQFSQLEQLSNMNEKLGTFAGMSDQVERQSALGLMGKKVVVQSDHFTTDGGGQTLGYRLDEPAAKVTLYVLDSQGNNVATLAGRGTTRGEYFVDWNGQKDSGQPAGAGSYRLVVHAQDQAKKALDATSLLQSMVTGVELNAGKTDLSTAAGTFSMAKLEKVKSSTP